MGAHLILTPIYKGVTSLLLDTLSASAAVAYSTRRLRAAYAGNCITVRRSSDNTTQNIGFVSNTLDTTSLTSFVGANDGLVTTWFDQSGNAVNASQSTNANQPKIVIGGTIQTMNGHPTIVFDNTNFHGQELDFSATQAQPLTVALASRLNSPVLDGHHFTDGSTRLVVGVTNSGVNFQIYAGGAAADIGGTTDTTTNHSYISVFQDSISSGSSILYQDNVNIATGASIGTVGLGSPQQIGAGISSGTINGQVSEFIVLATNIGSTDRTTIYNSMKTQWGTP
jgi:hypothetical protein